MDVRTALQRYLRHHRGEGSSPHTISVYTRWVGQFAAYLDGQHHSGLIGDLCADDLRGWFEYLRSRGNAQRSVRTKALHVKAFARWLVAEEYLAKDPFFRVSLPKADDTAKPTLSPTEIETLLASCNRRRLTGVRDRAIMLTLYSTGIRCAELAGIHVGDVDHARGQIKIRRGKGGKFRIVPLSPKVERAIDAYLEYPERKAQDQGGYLFLNQTGSPLSDRAIMLVFRRMEQKTGIHANPHKWRHSSAVQYLRSGGRLEVLQKLLGHTTLTMTLHYARVAGVDVTTAHETADPVRSLKTRG